MTAASPYVPDVLRRRLQGQHLHRRAKRGSLAEVVHDVCGLQAQVAIAPLMGAWARVDALRRVDLDRALWEERTLVRTWAMRGTVHVVSVAQYLALVGVWSERQRGEHHDEALARAIDKALGAAPLTRAELADAVAAKIGPGARQKMMHPWGIHLSEAVKDGCCVFGPPRGREVTFVNPRHWLGVRSLPDPACAREELTTQYLGAYGPAAPADLAYWLGVRVTDAKRFLHEAGAVPGEAGYDLAASSRASKTRRDAVRLLPQFDAYVLGHKNKDTYLEPALRREVFRSAARVAPVLLVDGTVVGTWRYERTSKRLRATFSIFPSNGDVVAVHRSAIEREVSSLAAMFDVDPTIEGL